MGKRRRVKKREVKIQYPPLTLRKWVPPYMKKRKPAAKPPPYPPQMHAKLDRSSLKRVWHGYDVMHGCAVMHGHYSQCHKRYGYVSNGYQGAANCVMAVLYSKLMECTNWTPFHLDHILDSGDKYYVQCRKELKSKHHLRIEDLQRELYLFNYKIFVNLKARRLKAWLHRDAENPGMKFLGDLLAEFFEAHDSGVISTCGSAGRHFAVWKLGTGFWWFDPADHDLMCWPWKEIAGRGVCFVIRFPSTDKLVQVIHRNLGPQNVEVEITPISIERIVSINLRYPDCLADANLEQVDEKASKLKEAEVEIKKQEAYIEPVAEEEMVSECDNDDDGKVVVQLAGDSKMVQSMVLSAAATPAANSAAVVTPASATVSAPPVTSAAIVASAIGAGDEGARPPMMRRKVFQLKPRVESITFCNDLIPDHMGILMADTHQEDPDFSKCSASHASTCNAVAALVMLRETKSKYWTTQSLNNVLRLGFRICLASRAAPTQKFTVHDLTKRIELFGKLYSPVITDLSAIGKLLSQDEAVLDLYPALKELLSDCDTVIVQGPSIVAVWKELDRYYMFDPNERGPSGGVIEKEIRVGSTMEPVDYARGVACLLWFSDLADLSETYLRNLDKSLRKETFVLSNVEIVDYCEPPEPYENYRALCGGRWILRGHFSQADRIFERIARDTQCTANCAMAIAMAHITPLKDWTPETLDDVLIKGNKYYQDCVRHLQRKEKFVSYMLMAKELDTEFPVDNRLAIMDVQECVVNGYITVHETPKDSLDLKEALGKFFQDYDCGILMLRGIAVAVMKHKGFYYYFDSHDRDENGFNTFHGKSCVQRFDCYRPMTEVIMANVSPPAASAIEGEDAVMTPVLETIFNINAIEVTICTPPDQEPALDEDDDIEDTLEDFDEEEDDYSVTGANLLSLFKVEVKPYNYTKLTKQRAILRSTHHQEDARYDRNAGKQTIGNLVAAIGYSRMFAPRRWCELDFDEILRIGNEIYEKSMYEYYKKQHGDNLREGEDEDDNDVITTSNVVKEFKIGINKFNLEVEEAEEEPLADTQAFMKRIVEYLKSDPTDKDDCKEMILQVEENDIVIWKSGELYYMLDPKPRDEKGDIYGRTDWSEPEISVYEQADYQYDFGEGEDEGMDYERFNWPPVVELPAEEEELDLQAYEMKEEPDWDELKRAGGRACVMWFVKPRHILKHLIENVHPRTLEDAVVKVTKLRLVNAPETKQTAADEGDWHDFKEVDKDLWVLRATMHQKNALFPESNRGKQTDANCLVAIGFSTLYGPSKYTPQTLDSILKYGDRLYTGTKRLRRKEVQENTDVSLTAGEVEEVLDRECYTIDKLLKSFCISDDSLVAVVKEDFMTGEVSSPKDAPNGLHQMLKSFFEGGNQYCVISAKGVSVAIFKIRDYIFSFDPCERGPNGVKFAPGVACLVRTKDSDKIADIFLSNIPKIGKNYVALHKIVPQPGSCLKPVKVETRIVDDPLKVAGFVPFARGRHIIRGTVCQDHAMFARGTNAQSSVIALVALAMSLIHRTEYWTKLIVDEVIKIGDGVYGELLDRCDFNFNPWEEHLTIEMAPTDFRIGKVKVNCQLRNTVQTGLVDTKEPNELNLRRAMEFFFEENSYGVFQTDLLTVAMWEGEDEEDKNYIYILDPNCRGPTGQPVLEDGCACLLKFCGAKLASDHIVGLLAGDFDAPFTIVPIEICIEKHKKKKKTKGYGEKKPEQEDKSKTEKLGRCAFYKVPESAYEILRGTRSQYSKVYSEPSRGNQDVPNCIISYVMDKLVPLTRWNYTTLDMILDVGDQLYKDSYIAYDPKDKKLRMETLIRDVIIRDIRVKISVGAPIIAGQFNMKQLTEGLFNSFNVKPFCVLLADDEAVSVFKKDEDYYLFDPMDLDLHGNRIDEGTGSCAVLKFQTMDDMIVQAINILTSKEKKETFHIIVVGIRKIERIEWGPHAEPGNLLKPDYKTCDACDKQLYGSPKSKLVEKKSVIVEEVL